MLGLCLLFSALAFLSKSTAVILPAVFLLQNFLEGEKQSRRQMAWFWAGLGVCTLTVIAATLRAQSELGFSAENVSPWKRPWIVLDSYQFYLSRMFLPLHLSVDLGRPPSWVLAQGTAVGFLAAFLGISALGWVATNEKIPTTTRLGTAVLLLCLLPVSGTVSFVHQFISTPASRYAYFAILGATLGGIGWSQKPRALALWAVFLLALCVQTARLLPTWDSEHSLYSFSAQENPHGWFSHYQLGRLEAAAGKPEAARAEWERAARNGPSRPEPRLALARLAREEGETQRAKSLYLEITRDFPGMLNAYWELAGIYRSESDGGQAEVYLDAIRRALALPAGTAAQTLTKYLQN